MKYIRFSKFKGAKDVFVFFPNVVHHLDMARIFKSSDESTRVISAGFVGINAEGEMYCHGQSIGLGVTARPEDNDLIRLMNE